MALPLTTFDGDPRLASWRAAVGAPVAVSGPSSTAPTATAPELLVVTWNLWIGRGRLRDAIARARAACAHGPGEAELPMVLLLQEAYRNGSAVPPAAGRIAGATDFSRRAFPEHDI